LKPFTPLRTHSNKSRKSAQASYRGRINPSSNNRISKKKACVSILHVPYTYTRTHVPSNIFHFCSAHVYDVMRSQLPTLELDAVFEAKEELALAVKNALSKTMTAYGYQILQALITDLDPDQRVKNAMNEINSSKRLKYAVAERAEGDKILQVKSAEAEAEAKYLSGVGVAKQRKAIVDGLRTSIVDFADNIEGSSTKEVMDLLLLTQYFDMIRDVVSCKSCLVSLLCDMMRCFICHPIHLSCD
jgi:hypothetical protein